MTKWEDIIISSLMLLVILLALLVLLFTLPAVPSTEIVTGWSDLA